MCDKVFAMSAACRVWLPWRTPLPLHTFRTLRSSLRTFHMQKTCFCSTSDTASKKAEPKLRIYTRTGDKGMSSNFAGQRLPKDDEIFEALGSNDELTSFIGLAREFCLEANHASVASQLQEVQCLLQDVGSHIATPRDCATEKKLARTSFGSGHVDKLENWIDEMDEALPPLTTFILPSGGKSSSSLHVARGVCRRTERRVVPLFQSGKVEQDVAKFLNRLSDFLFTAARYVAHGERKEEVIYQKVDA